MRGGLIIGALCLFGTGVQAETQQDWAVECLSKMETETSWPECRKGLFAPCAENAVGSEPHLKCLRGEKDNWRVFLDKKTEVLNAKLTLEGAGQLTDLLGQWFGYVGNKCAAVGEEKAEISRDAGQLGCEISEFAGLATEFNSCLTGNSVSPYCTIKE